ncbi:MAG: heme exporter protein CcmB [Deltaproteobacteria bacterium]|nr:heme exporter protein CcmB [Deltaproteobacteria bacterium]
MKIFTLIKKDLLQELRAKESLAFMFSLSILFSVVLGIAVNSALLNQESVTKLFPGLLWVIFIFSATMTVERSLQNEMQHMALEGLLLLGVSSFQIFIAKLVSNTLLSGLGFLLCTFFLAILLDIGIVHVAAPFTLIASLTVIGYSALATVAVAISSSSQLKSLLLPLILIPLLFPLFFAATELGAVLFAGGAFDPASGWLSLLIALDVLYIVLGMNLYEYVIKE